MLYRDNEISFFRKNGYWLDKSRLTMQEISNLRKTLKEHFSSDNWTKTIHQGGKVQPYAFDYIPDITWLLERKDIWKKLEELTGEVLYYIHHADAHMNMHAPPHRDSPNYISDPWDGQHSLYRIMIYLQEHPGKAGNGLSVMPGSHRDSSLEDSYIHIDVVPGDVIFFDQRILHYGHLPITKEQINEQPILDEDRLAIIYGVGGNNAKTKEFIINNNIRQKKQVKIDEYNISAHIINALEKSNINYIEI